MAKSILSIFLKWFLVVVPALLIVFISGCDSNNRILDPSQIGRFRPVPAVNVILDSLGVEDEEPPAWKGAEEPLHEDAVAQEGDYTFGSGDIIRIQIYELLEDNTPFQNDYMVNETGKINIIEIGVVDVAGLTEVQLEEELRNILKPNILKEPLVTVTLLRSEKKTFSISGTGVRTSARQTIPRYNFRLLDALANAGGMSQFNVSYVYVSRPIGDKQIQAGSAGAEYQQTEETASPEKEMMRMLVPNAGDRKGEGKKDKQVVLTSSEMVTDDELLQAARPEGLDILSELSKLQTTPEETSEKVEWIFQDGKWVAIPIQKEAKVPPVTEPSAELKPAVTAKVSEAGAGPRARLIKIPTEKLWAGDPRYNIVIKDGDSVIVPVDMIGEFCVMGNVNVQGFFNITGRPLTLKMAIAAAGGLGPLAYPKHCEITRRIGKDREETVMVNLDKIARGEQPDVFIKPNDLINVGTSPTSIWRAQLRNGLRATYGFELVYTQYFTDRVWNLRKPLGIFGY